MSKKHSTEEKQNLVHRYLEGETVTNLAMEFEISKSTAYLWIKKFKVVTADGKKLITGREIFELQRKVNRLEDTIAVLKTVNCSCHYPLQDKLCELENLCEKYSVHVLCDALNVARGTFYNHIKRNKRDNVWYKKRREILCDEIRRIFDENNQIFGARKITAILKNNGEAISEEYVRKLMIEMNLISIRTNSKKEYLSDKRRRNILKQHFKTDCPNVAWVSDITYFKYSGKWFFICAILDLYSRKVIAYKIGTSNSTQLTKSTMKISIESRKPTSDLIFHSDNGGNYTSHTFTKYLADNNIIHSFSKARNPYDNSVAESFFSSLKREELYRRKFKSESEFKDSVHEYIDFYNTRRPHATINYKTPKQFELKYYGSTEYN